MARTSQNAADPVRNGPRRAEAGQKARRGGNPSASGSQGAETANGTGGRAGAAPESPINQVKALRRELGMMTRELAEFRQQLATAQELSIREARQGHENISKELTAAGTRLGEAVRHANEQIAEVVRQAREARHLVESLRQQDKNLGEPPVAPARSRRGKKGPVEPTDDRSTASLAGENKDRLGVTVRSAFVVTEVLRNTPAEAAGLTYGDAIETLNEQTILDTTDLLNTVQNLKDGDDVKFEVIRAGEKRTLRTKLQKRSPKLAKAKEGQNRLGLTVDLKLVVAELVNDSPAQHAGLAQGDVIEAVDGTTVTSAEQFRELIQRVPANTDAILRIGRSGNQIEVNAKLDAGG